MKTRYIAWVLLALAVLAVGVMLYPGTGRAQKEAAKPARTVTVTGVGRAKMQADGARVSLGVRVAGAKFTAANEDARKTADRVAEAVRNLRLQGVTVKTLPIDAHATGAAPAEKDKEKPAEPFAVVHPLLVVILDSDAARLRTKAAKVLQTALETGANHGGVSVPNYGGLGGGLGGPPGGGISTASSPRVEFFVQDDGQARRDALKLATAAAIANARAVAKNEDAAVVSISDGSDIPFAYNMSESSQPDGSGEIELTVRVRVTCAY